MSAVLEPVTAADAMVWGRTRRLLLREFQPHDLEAVMRMHSDPRLRAHLVDDYPLHERAVAQLFLERLPFIYRQHEGLGIWHASVLQPDPVFAGWFSLMRMPGRPNEVELGSRLLPLAWGSGLALEGCDLLLEHAFTRLGLARLWGVCHPDNRSAGAVLATLGFAPSGLLPYDGMPASHHQIGLNEWRAACNTPLRSRLRRALRALSLRDETAASSSEELCQ